MTLQDYQQATQRTLPDLGSMELNIAHMIFGMNSEFSELVFAEDDVNRGEELTDVMWYVSNWCNMRNIDMWRIFEFLPQGYYCVLPLDDYNTQMQSAISRLTDLEKKLLAYKKTVTREQYINAITDVLERVNDCYTYYDLNPFVCMQNNIDKLKVRFPEKFSEFHANNRDLETERKELEKTQL